MLMPPWRRYRIQSRQRVRGSPPTQADGGQQEPVAALSMTHVLNQEDLRCRAKISRQPHTPCTNPGAALTRDRKALTRDSFAFLKDAKSRAQSQRGQSIFADGDIVIVPRPHAWSSRHARLRPSCTSSKLEERQDRRAHTGTSFPPISGKARANTNVDGPSFPAPPRPTVRNPGRTGPSSARALLPDRAMPDHAGQSWVLHGFVGRASARLLAAQGRAGAGAWGVPRHDLTDRRRTASASRLARPNLGGRTMPRTCSDDLPRARPAKIAHASSTMCG
jgi:hypothetical protein